MKKVTKKSKLLFILVAIVICIVAVVLLYKNNIINIGVVGTESQGEGKSIKSIFDIKPMLSTSKEYKNLYDFSYLEFYKKNHLLIQEDGQLYSDINNYHFDNKEISTTMFYVNDDKDLVKASVCFDNDVKMSYAMYQYKEKAYVKYNNYSDKIYNLYNFCQKGSTSTDKSVPDFSMFEGYKPQFIGRYYNVDGDEDIAYMELYELSFIDDVYYKNALKDYFTLDEKGYLKVYVNKMKLISSIGISKGKNEDCVLGPYLYEYYYDRNYDLSGFYEYANNKDNLLKVALVDVDNGKTIDTINVNIDSILMLEYGDIVSGVYMDKECKNDYKEIINNELRGVDQSIINKNGDFTLYVKYK